MKTNLRNALLCFLGIIISCLFDSILGGIFCFILLISMLFKNE